MMNAMKKVLVVAPHPDDETLGCGGTLLKHKACGDAIHWLIATSVREENGFERSIVETRKNEIQAVSAMYEFDGVHPLDFPTTKVDEIPMNVLVNSIYNVFKKVEPNIIYLPFQNDIHTDHQIVFKAAYSCTKCFRFLSIEKIIMMEILSETEFAPATQTDNFIPNMFVDITDFLDRKIEIVKGYEGEIGKHPFPRSERNIRALATLRGATAGCEDAEAFMIIKEINR